MTLIINGESRTYDAGTTLAAIMRDLGIEEKVMAAAVNMQIVKKEAWESYTPADGDTLELLHFVGGG